MSAFELNARIEQDSFPIGNLGLCQVRLINDRRWPWLLLVPQRNGLTELHDLPIDEQKAVALATNECAKMLQQMTDCKTINSGSLGNVVEQLHIHVVARNEGDPNWPNSVWGFESSIAYADAERKSLIAQLTAKLNEKRPQT